MRTLDKAEIEMAKGNLWRAKEILQGSIPNTGYHCDVFERLGIVLLAMGDLPEAGRFLFLSDRRKGEYELAIDVFLMRHRKNPRALFQRFPRAARLASLSEYPGNVRLELAELGFPEVLKGDKSEFNSAHSASEINSIIAWLIVGLSLVVMILGIVKVIEIIRWL